jgi:putative transposase
MYYGSQFTAAEFKDLVQRFAFKHIRIRWYHPESNGLVERFHRSTRGALGDRELRTLTQARALIADWVREYNEVRLHAGLGYLAPAEFYRGDPAARLTERQTKLAKGRERRRAINQARLSEAA